jgi:chromatin remodeling complex protein RSC6
MSAKPSHSNSNMSTEVSKTAKKTAASKKVVEPVAAVTSAPAAAEPKAKAPRKTAAKTEVVVPTVETATSAAPAAEATTTETAAPSSSIGSVVERLRDVRARFSNELKEIIAETLLAAKTAAREVKDAKRKRRAKKDVSEMTEEERTAWEARRAKNAFLKPRALSGELCSFMSLPAGSQRSQTEVTKFVSNYVKSHSCFDPANKRHIIPDGALSRLLRVTDKDTVTYLNLQSFLKVHFLKA